MIQLDVIENTFNKMLSKDAAPGAITTNTVPVKQPQQLKITKPKKKKETK